MKIRGLCRHKYSWTAEELSGFSTINAFGFTMDSAFCRYTLAGLGWDLSVWLHFPSSVMGSVQLQNTRQVWDATLPNSCLSGWAVEKAGLLWPSSSLEPYQFSSKHIQLFQ